MFIFETKSEGVKSKQHDANHLQSLKSFSRLAATKIFNGLSQVMIKIRVGHTYTYQASPVSPLTTSPTSSVSSYSWNEEDDDCMTLNDSMDEFFQQFPLFVEVIIRVKPTEAKLSPSTHLLLTVENAGINPDRPFMILEEIDFAGIRA